MMLREKRQMADWQMKQKRLNVVMLLKEMEEEQKRKKVEEGQM